MTCILSFVDMYSENVVCKLVFLLCIGLFDSLTCALPTFLEENPEPPFPCLWKEVITCLVAQIWLGTGPRTPLLHTTQCPHPFKILSKKTTQPLYHSLIYKSIETYCVLGTMLVAKGTMLKKITMALPSWSLESSGGCK